MKTFLLYVEEVPVLSTQAPSMEEAVQKLGYRVQEVTDDGKLARLCDEHGCMLDLEEVSCGAVTHLRISHVP